MKTTEKLKITLTFLSLSGSLCAQLSGSFNSCDPNPFAWYIGGNVLSQNAPVSPPPHWAPLPMDIGTCNQETFILKSNNLQSVFITSQGYIGINNPSPSTALDIKSPTSGQQSSFRIYGNLNGDVESTTDIRFNSATNKDVFFNEGTVGSNLTRMMVQHGGNIGIGTTAPSSKLTIDATGLNGTSLNGLNVIAGASGYAMAVHNSSGGIYAIWPDGRLAIGNTNSPDLAKVNINMNAAGRAFNVYDIASSNAYFTIDNNGKTKIGLLSPNAHPNALLTVYGEAVATDIYVTGISNWSDFVFDEDYKLMSIMDVEKYYTKTHHLPNVPSAKEVAADGINLGKTDAILLQKIEELTLYVVEQQKQIIELSKRLSEPTK